MAIFTLSLDKRIVLVYNDLMIRKQNTLIYDRRTYRG